MSGSMWIYAASILLISWGFAHLFPTRKVIIGFGDVSADNKRVIQMEWINEGVALVFIGVLVAVVTFLDRTSKISRVVYWTSFCVLNVLSTISLFTGFRNSFIMFKLCPFIFTGSSVLIMVGCYLD